MTSIDGLVFAYNQILGVYEDSLVNFEQNIKGRFNTILDESTKIVAKNWEELQLIYQARNEVDDLNLKLNRELAHIMKSLSYAKAMAQRMRTKPPTSLPSLVEKKQLWIDRLDGLKQSKLYTTNYQEMADIIENKMKAFVGIMNPNLVHVSSFVKPTIKYNGGTIESVVERVVKEVMSTANLAKAIQNETESVKVIATTETFLQETNLEIMKILDDIQKKLVNLEHHTPPPSVFGDDPFIDDDALMDTSFYAEAPPISLEDKFDTFVSDFNAVKSNIASLMDNVKFETVLEKLSRSVEMIQAQVSILADANLKTLNEINAEEEAEFKRTLQTFIQRIEDRLHKLELSEKNNLSGLKHLDLANEQMKDLLMQTETTILHTFRDHAASFNKLEQKLIEDTIKENNQRAESIDAINFQIFNLSTQGKTQTTNIIERLSKLTEAVQKIESAETIHNYVTTDMITKMLPSLTATNQNDIIELTKTILSETEAFREKILSELQVRYNALFLDTGERINAQVVGLETSQTKLATLLKEQEKQKSELATVKATIEALQKSLEEKVVNLQKIDGVITTQNTIAAKLESLQQIIADNNSQMEITQSEPQLEILRKQNDIILERIQNMQAENASMITSMQEDNALRKRMDKEMNLLKTRLEKAKIELEVRNTKLIEQEQKYNDVKAALKPATRTKLKSKRPLNLDGGFHFEPEPKTPRLGFNFGV